MDPRIASERTGVVLRKRSETVSSRAFHPIGIPLTETPSDSNSVDPAVHGAAALITIIAVISIGGILGIDNWQSNYSSYAPVSPTPSHDQAPAVYPQRETLSLNRVSPLPSATVSNESRKDFFSNVHRTAVQFNPNAPEFPEQLRIELQLIEGAAKTQREKEVLKLFTLIEETQRSIAAIEELWEGTKTIRDQ